MATAPSRRIPTSQVLLGGIIILVGILLLLQTTNVFPTRRLLRYTPLLFVAVGVWALAQGRFRNIVGPVLLIGIAGAAQIVILGYATVDDVLVFWPVIVIAIGASILLGKYRSTIPVTHNAFTSAFALFGGVERRNSSKAFVGGDLTSMFGEVELDLREAAIEEPPARINTTALFGDIDIIVPRGWNVHMDVLPILASANDVRSHRDGERDHVDVFVTGFGMFADISVRD